MISNTLKTAAATLVLATSLVASASQGYAAPLRSTDSILSRQAAQPSVQLWFDQAKGNFE